MDIFRRLCGEVLFQVEGGAAGRFLTLAAGDGVRVWDTTHRDDLLYAKCIPKDYARLRTPAKRAGVRMRLCQKRGAAFRIHRYRTRYGILAGIAVYLALLLFFGGRIWSVEFLGLQNAEKTALESFLAARGVSVGTPKRHVDPTAIQLDALGKLEEVSWLSVHIDGCIARVEIKEPNADEVPIESDAPSNLVAARDGVIREISVTSGDATVKVGEAVAEGCLLACGITATEQGVLFRRSTGVVLAETEREISVCVPLSETRLLPAEAHRSSLELHFFGLRLPLSVTPPPNEPCRTEESDHLLTIDGTALPIGTHLRRHTPLFEKTITRTVLEAEALATEQLTEKETALAKEATLLSKEITRTTDNNAVVFKGKYRCLENIAKEVPLQIANSFES